MNEDTTTLHTLFLDSAVDVARAGGAVLIEELDRERTVEYKGLINLVTDADRRSERTIVKILRERFPDHQILAEEGTTSSGRAAFRWIIDPLDGTTNYAHRYPHFAVSVGLEHEGRPIIGAVYDPIRDELFTARVGGGAYLNGERLRVSSTPSLIQGLLCTGFPYDRDQFGPSLSRWDRFIRSAQAVRRDGSAALDLCYVAAGRFDGFWEDHLRPWDAAAGVLIVREAGGRVTDFEGRGADIHRGEVLASNGLLHDEMLAILSNADLVGDGPNGRGPNGARAG